MSSKAMNCTTGCFHTKITTHWLLAKFWPTIMVAITLCPTNQPQPEDFAFSKEDVQDWEGGSSSKHDSTINQNMPKYFYVVWILYKVVQQCFLAPRIYKSGIAVFAEFGYLPL